MTGSSRPFPWPGLVGLLFVTAYVAGYLLPDQWWGTHFIAFIPGWSAIVLLVAAGALCMVPSPLDRALHWVTRFAGRRALFAAGMAAVFFTLYLSNKIATDIYGDARLHLTALEQMKPGLQAAWFRDLLLPALEVDTGERTVYALVAIVANVTGAGIEWVFRLMNAASGATFVFAWIWLVLAEVEQPALRLALVLAGVAAPFTAVFLGHTEIYAPSYAVTMLFWAAVIRLARHGGWRWTILALVALYALVQLHVSNVMFVPVYGLALWFGHAPPRWRKRTVRWRTVILVVGLAFAAGAVWYFSRGLHVGTQVVKATEPHTRWVLPLVPSYDAPPYHYMLFSYPHLFDTLNFWTLWAPAAWLLVACVVFARRGRIEGDDPALLVGATGFVLVAAMFFVSNPALTPMRDWDLWCFPATSLLVVSLLVARQLPKAFESSVLGPAVALALLALPGFHVQTDTERLSHRLESAGIWAFASYWNGATYTLNVAIRMIEAPPEQMVLRRDVVLEKLKAVQKDPKDEQIAHMIANVGYEYARMGNHRAAYDRFVEALTMNPGTGSAIEGMPAAAFFVGDYETSLQYSLKVLSVYPDRPRYMELGLRSAVELGDVKNAVELARTLLAAEPDSAEWVNKLLLELNAPPGE